VKRLPLNKDRIPIVVKIPDAIGDERLDDYFRSICTCINEKRSIDIVYNALHSKETSERRVDPYGLVFYEGAWILISYCHLRVGMRNFALDRISALRKTNFHFKMREGFDLKEDLIHSWGIDYDKENVEVTVRFAEKVADYILRKDKWHPSEKRKILPSGEVELSFTVSGVNEIRRWIYAWVPNVEVIEPAWFRDRLRKEFTEAAHKHS
jgi:predicted DNA-binding transcriptional regulator YafY